MQQTCQLLQEKTQGLDAQGIVNEVVAHFGNKIALATSFGAEDQVLTDMVCKAGGEAQLFTLDTGRIHQETYDVLAATEKHYDRKIEVMFPKTDDVQDMVNTKGINLFRESVENRKICCGVRKMEPLRRKLGTLDAWLVGLRQAQSVTRTALESVEIDENNGLIKVSPLAQWSEEDVWDYIKANNLPYNALHDKGFPSIGCDSCTRAIEKGEDVRAGRWWWEAPEHKECGLHNRPTK